MIPLTDTFRPVSAPKVGMNVGAGLGAGLGLWVGRGVGEAVDAQIGVASLCLLPDGFGLK